MDGTVLERKTHGKMVTSLPLIEEFIEVEFQQCVCTCAHMHTHMCGYVKWAAGGAMKCSQVLNGTWENH